MAEAQGERMQPGPSCRGAREGEASATTASRLAPPPGAHSQPWHGAGGCRAPAPHRRLELSTRRAVILPSVSPRCLNEGRWVAASCSSCNLPPSSPRPRTVFLLFFFFSAPDAAACPHDHRRPLGGIPWQMPVPSASRGDGKHGRGSSSPPPARRMARRDACELGTGL